jgi:hypothetical protein
MILVGSRFEPSIRFVDISIGIRRIAQNLSKKELGTHVGGFGERAQSRYGLGEIAARQRLDGAWVIGPGGMDARTQGCDAHADDQLP